MINSKTLISHQKKKVECPHNVKTKEQYFLTKQRMGKDLHKSNRCNYRNVINVIFTKLMFIPLCQSSSSFLHKQLLLAPTALERLRGPKDFWLSLAHMNIFKYQFNLCQLDQGPGHGLVLVHSKIFSKVRTPCLLQVTSFFERFQRS